MSTASSTSAGLFMLGATHHRVPLEIREKLSLSVNGLDAMHRELATISSLREFSILNTCNRVEFYGVAESNEALLEVQRRFCLQQSFPIEAFQSFSLKNHNFAAVQHLLEVASGLDSQLIGETEIFGQVKGAYAEALQRNSAGPVLNRVFQKTFHTAKHVRTHTAISSGQVSISNVAVDLAQSIFGDLSNTRILLLGAGEIGEKTARAFQSRGAGGLTVASRSMEHAMALASTLNATALPFELRDRHLPEFDIVVCCTAAPGALVTTSAVIEAMKQRSARPLFFIDLAMPRDVEAAVADISNAYLYNLDDLAAIAEQNRSARQTEMVKCRLILRERAETLWSQIESRLKAPQG